MLRSTWWLALAALAGVSTTGSARAQECEDDSQCPTSTYCGWESVDVGSDDGVATDAPCAPDSDCGLGEPPPPGACQPLPRGECEVQADCAEGLECVKGEYVNPCTGTVDPEPAPAPGGGAEPPGGEDIALPPECDQEVHVSRYGTCQMALTPCETDDQCLNGLTCLPAGGSSSSGSSDSSGGATEPDTGADVADPGKLLPPDESYCGYAPPSCEGGEACEAGFTCVELEVGGTCSSSDVACAPGEECGAEEPQEPECTTEYAKVCLPTKAPCETDAQCSDGWKCVAFSNDGDLPEPPPFWEETGAVKSCVPEGIAIALESGNGIGRGDSLGGGEGTVDNSTGAPETPEAASGGKSSSGCSVGAAGGNSAGLAGFLIAGLAMVRRRRRR